MLDVKFLGGYIMDFSKRIMELRKRAGWSQEELGYRLGVSRQTVSKWELGDTTPEMSKLTAMSQLFNVSLDYLVKGEETNSITSKNNGDYEYKSKAMFNGVPVVHINMGKGMKRAKGIVAIGNIATGVVAIGGLSTGIVSLGGFSIGIVSLGGLAAGLVAIGGLGLGYIAFGGVTLGYLALGGVAFGVNAAGGVAVARDIAFGDYAKGTIAIGYRPFGEATINRIGNVDAIKNAFNNAVNDYLPMLKNGYIDFLCD